MSYEISVDAPFHRTPVFYSGRPMNEKEAAAFQKKHPGLYHQLQAKPSIAGGTCIAEGEIWYIYPENNPAARKPYGAQGIKAFVATDSERKKFFKPVRLIHMRDADLIIHPALGNIKAERAGWLAIDLSGAVEYLSENQAAAYYECDCQSGGRLRHSATSKTAAPPRRNSTLLDATDFAEALTYRRPGTYCARRIQGQEFDEVLKHNPSLGLRASEDVIQHAWEVSVSGAQQPAYWTEDEFRKLYHPLNGGPLFNGKPVLRGDQGEVFMPFKGIFLREVRLFKDEDGLIVEAHKGVWVMRNGLGRMMTCHNLKKAGFISCDPHNGTFLSQRRQLPELWVGEADIAARIQKHGWWDTRELPVLRAHLAAHERQH